MRVGSSHVLRSVRYLQPYKSRIAVVVGLTLLAGALPALEPLVQGSLFDTLVASGSQARLIAPLATLVVLVLLRQVLEAATAILSWRVRLPIHRDLLAHATGRLHALPLSYHQGRGVGETMTRLDRGISSYTEGLACFAFQIAPAFLYFTVSMGILVALCPLLALVAAAFLVPPLVIGGATRRELVDRERAILDRWCAIYDRFCQVLSGIKTVKAFARELDEHRQFVEQVEGAQREVLGSIQVQTRLAFERTTWMNLGRIAVLGVGGVLVLRGSIGVGTLVAAIGYVAGLYTPAQTLLAVRETMRKAELGLETFFGVMDAEDAVPDKEGAFAPVSLRGAIHFDRVTHHYGRRAGGRPALDGVTVSIHPGELIAIVGSSGAGKTTLAELILRMHDPSSGTVRIDEHDLRDLSQLELRKRIGIVTQEPFLFDDTIASNIRYGAPGASDDEVRHAARMAHALGFIERLSEGFESRVGRGGVQLSGGERQRIAVARILLKNPSVIVFDEPTSSLDVEGEQLVEEAIQRVAKGRTTIVIAHRLGATARADRVLVLEEGRLVEKGSPAELFLRRGAYHRMLTTWWKQTRPPQRGTLGITSRDGVAEALDGAS